MKFFIIPMMLCALAGCVQHGHALPEVSGNLQPINSSSVMQEVNHV